MNGFTYSSCTVSNGDSLAFCSLIIVKFTQSLKFTFTVRKNTPFVTGPLHYAHHLPINSSVPIGFTSGHKLLRLASYRNLPRIISSCTSETNLINGADALGTNCLRSSSSETYVTLNFRPRRLVSSRNSTSCKWHTYLEFSRREQ